MGGLARRMTGWLGGVGGTGGSLGGLQETNEMMGKLIRDRDELSKRLADESAARKRAEQGMRELERKLKIGSARDQLESRKARDAAGKLEARKEEINEMRAMLQHQTLEIKRLESNDAKKSKQLGILERKLSQYEDSFLKLETRNVQDHLRMQAMGEAKNKAEEEKSTYRAMLETAHERWLKERQRMIGDAVAATENFRHVNSEQQKVIITQKRRLEEVTARAEEADMYKEKAHELMELIAGMGGAPPGGAAAAAAAAAAGARDAEAREGGGWRAVVGRRFCAREFDGGGGGRRREGARLAVGESADVR